MDNADRLPEDLVDAVVRGGSVLALFGMLACYQVWQIRGEPRLHVPNY